MSLRLLFKKWYIILLCALLGAGGLYFEKNQVSDIVPQSGDMTYIRVVRFDTVPVFTANQTSTEVNVMNLTNSWSSFVTLESKLANYFEMDKLNAEFSKNSDSQKMKWLGDHFRVQRTHHISKKIIKH